MSRLSIGDCVHGQVYWVKQNEFPFWPARLAWKSEGPAELHAQTTRSKVVARFFGTHDFILIGGAKTKVCHFYLGVKPPGSNKFGPGERDLEVQYNEALVEARQFYELPAEERNKCYSSNESSDSDSDDGVIETLKESDKEMVEQEEKQKNQGKYNTRSHKSETDSDSDVFKSEGKYETRSKAPKQSKPTKKKAAPRASRSRSSSFNKKSRTKGKIDEDPIEESDEAINTTSTRVTRRNSDLQSKNTVNTEIEEVERPNKKRKSNVPLGDSEDDQHEKRQVINLEKPQIDKQPSKKKTSATSLVSVPVMDKTKTVKSEDEEEEDPKADRVVKSEDEDAEEPKVYSVSSSPVSSPPLQITPQTSSAELIQHQDEFDETCDSQEKITTTLDKNDITANTALNTTTHSTGSTNNTNSTGSKYSVGSKSTTSSSSLNSHGSTKSTKNNHRNKYTFNSDDESDNKTIAQKFHHILESDRATLERSQSEGITSHLRDTQKQLSENILTHHSSSPISHINNNSNSMYYNNQSNMLNPLIQKHKIPDDEVHNLNSQYPPKYYSFSNNNNNKRDTKATTKTETPNKYTSKSNNAYIQTQTYNNSPEPPDSQPPKATSQFLHDSNHVADSQVPNHTRKIDLQNDGLQISESNISTLAVDEFDSGDKVENITPTMRVQHTSSQCQPVPHSQLATPSVALIAYGMDDSPTRKVLEYYNEKQKKKRGSNNSNNNNTDLQEFINNQQFQDAMYDMISKAKNEIEVGLRQEFEQKYSAAIQELKQENGDLRSQMEKLGDEIVVSRAEVAALSKQFSVNAEKTKNFKAFFQQLEEQEANLKQMRTALVQQL